MNKKFLYKLAIIGIICGVILDEKTTAATLVPVGSPTNTISFDHRTAAASLGPISKITVRYPAAKNYPCIILDIDYRGQSLRAYSSSPSKATIFNVDIVEFTPENPLIEVSGTYEKIDNQIRISSIGFKKLNGETFGPYISKNSSSTGTATPVAFVLKGDNQEPIQAFFGADAYAALTSLGISLKNSSSLNTSAAQTTTQTTTQVTAQQIAAQAELAAATNAVIAAQTAKNQADQLASQRLNELSQAQARLTNAQNTLNAISRN